MVENLIDKENGVAESEPSRRDFLHFTGAALLGASLTALAGCGSNKSEEVQSAVAALELKLAPFREAYLRDGQIANPDQLNTLFLQTEHLRFFEVDGSTPARFVDFRSELFEPFKAAVGLRLQELLAEAAPQTEKLALLKQAMFATLSEDIQYNKKNNSVLDPIVNDRLQCRSGTQLFLLLARDFERDVLSENDSLVVIYTDTHELAGKINAEGRLVGFEMTSKGAGVVLFGNLPDCDVPMRVCHSDHIAAQAILGTRVHQDTVIIHDSLGADSLAGVYDKPIGVALGNGSDGTLKNLLDGAMNSATECFSFSSGTVEVPEGDRPLAERDYLSMTSYQSSHAPVPGAGGSASEARLMDRLSHSEQRTVLNYLQHNQYFKECFDRQVAVIKDPVAGRQAQLKQLEGIQEEIEIYWARNDLSDVRDSAGDVLRPKGLVPTMEPASIFNTIQHNYAVFQRK